MQKVNETPEERIARLEKEAYEAQEKAKAAMDASRAALTERQRREQECAKFNAIKIHNQWRKIMRMTTVDSLRGQIEILSQNHEREVDRKDAIIQMLDRDLEDSEEQFSMAVRGNMQVRGLSLAPALLRVAAAPPGLLLPRARGRIATRAPSSCVAALFSASASGIAAHSC